MGIKLIAGPGKTMEEQLEKLRYMNIRRAIQYNLKAWNVIKNAMEGTAITVSTEDVINPRGDKVTLEKKMFGTYRDRLTAAKMAIDIANTPITQETNTNIQQNNQINLIDVTKDMSRQEKAGMIVKALTRILVDKKKSEGLPEPAIELDQESEHGNPLETDNGKTTQD